MKHVARLLAGMAVMVLTALGVMGIIEVAEFLAQHIRVLILVSFAIVMSAIAYSLGEAILNGVNEWRNRE